MLAQNRRRPQRLCIWPSLSACLVISNSIVWRNWEGVPINRKGECLSHEWIFDRLELRVERYDAIAAAFTA